jgi:hypothetical protein
LGAKEGPPAGLVWSGLSSFFSAALFLRAVPWLVILGLFLLKPNRCRQAWWVWLPLLAVAGLGWGVAEFSWTSDEDFRASVHLLLTGLGFGWTATLLLAPSAVWPRKLGRFGCLLLGLGGFALLGLALGRAWERGMSEELTAAVCAVMLQFVVFALAAALSLAGWSVRRRFTLPAFLGWVFLWLIVVWLALIIPCATLSSLGGASALPGLLAIAGGWSLASCLVTLAFLVLGAANPLYHQRLQQLVVPPGPIY